MADKDNAQVAPAASNASSVVEATPAVVDSSSPAVVAVEPAAPVVTEVKAEAPAEVSKEVPKAESENPEDTLLTRERKTPEPEKKPEAESKPEPEAKPADAEVKVEPPKFEAFKLPENTKVDEAKIGDFTKMLGDFETITKTDHAEVQKLGQQLVDRHIEEMQRYEKSLVDAWNKQANDWKESFLKSPEFANRTDTVLNAAVDAIRIYGGDAKQQQEFHDLMVSSKLGNHPAMIRLLSNISLATPNPKPLAAPPIASAPKMSKISKMYGVKKTA